MYNVKLEAPRMDQGQNKPKDNKTQSSRDDVVYYDQHNTKQEASETEEVHE